MSRIIDIVAVESNELVIDVEISPPIAVAVDVVSPLSPELVEIAGSQGPQGDPGPPGAASTVPGPKGDKGDPGATGSQGAASTVPGPTGPQGVQGPTGAASTVPGPQGPQGAQGPAGPAGSPDTAVQVLAKLITVDGTGSGLDADLFDGQDSSFYAPIASPTFTGDPKAPTPTAGDNDTSIATTAFVTTALAAGGGSGVASGITFTPAGNIAATNVQTAIVELDTEKVAKAGDTMTGALVAYPGTGPTVPGISFSSATTTGIYISGGPNLNFTVGGSQRFVITGAGIIPTVVFKGIDGAVGGPSYSFNNEATSGLYRKTTGSVSISGNNSEVMNWVGSTKTTTAFGPVVLASYTVATLPSASTSGAGATAFVTDANAVTFNSVVAGGGTNKLPVFSDGTAWRIG